MSERLRIGAENFGPIANAVVELKPLTIFVGQNNTGKSYFALLVYAISHALSERVPFRRRFFSSKTAFLRFELPTSRLSMPTFLEEDFHFNTRTLDTLKRQILSSGRKKPPDGRTVQIPYQSLPKQLRDAVDAEVTAVLDSYTTGIARELKRCFGARLGDLVCKTTDRKDFCLFIEHEKPELRLRFELAGRKLKLSRRDFSLKDQRIDTTFQRSTIRHLLGGVMGEDVEDRGQKEVLELLASEIVMRGHAHFMDILVNGAYYLPAARSGILQGQKLLSSSLLRALPLAGIEPIAIPRFSGVVVDFLAGIGAIDKSERGDFYQLANHLEQELTPGRVELVEGKYEHPEIYFRIPEVGRLSLHRTSSMISELAPVVLFLRYLLQKGNIIILEEPEAHLHPAAQRELAKILVRLVRGGAQVILTTHSDYFLQQISNLVALSRKPSGRVESLGYTLEDLVSPEELGVYLFKYPEAGYATEVSAVGVGENGIIQEEFDEVAESLYDESVEARRKTQRSRDL